MHKRNKDQHCELTMTYKLAMNTLTGQLVKLLDKAEKKFLSLADTRKFKKEYWT